ncbi:MAG: HAMP domain-containing sensor histidine kinase [Actinomycetaceae bacterium]|nr:HAMP domain-containing sensor histidine kinase [Actinomycetaceae bacterium]MDU0970834.1 HAMP domain-containing sensor histidine kinase [Actinomycetaceae bacterium]
MTSQQPNYAPDNYLLPTKALDSGQYSDARLKPTRGHFVLANLRYRLTVNILALSFFVLLLMGSLIGITGVAQVHSAQDQQSHDMVAAVRTFARGVERTQNPTKPLSTGDIIYGFLTRVPHEPYSTVVGVIDGQARYYQTGRSVDLTANQQLMHKVSEVGRTTDRSRATTVRIDGRDYRLTVVPLEVARSEPGAIVLIQDVGLALAPTVNLLRIFAGVSLVVLSLVGMTTWRGLARVLKPLAQLRAMTRSVASGDDLTQRLPVSSDDDLGDLALSFNDMIDRLQKAFESQRHLLNDAGHELRTPLTVVQGHLELMDPNDPEDVVHTRDLVLDEVARMHRMTEDLIDVARASTPNFVRPQKTSLTELTLDVLQNAAQLGDQRFSLDNLGEGEIWADPQRLTQALLQLAENATKFSEPGSHIYIGSGINVDPQIIGPTGAVIPTTPVMAPGAGRPVGQWACLWVRDEGIGIEPRNARRVFDRFARVDHSKPGSGLGLTIVAAIASAHHGSLELRSVPGHGSVFALFIPFDGAGEKQEVAAHE